MLVSSEHPKISSVATVPTPLRNVLSRPYPELASAVAATNQIVCAGHVPRLRAEVAPARALDDDSALDDLPQVIDALAKVFAAHDGLTPIDLLGPGHASARDAQHFTVEEVFGEYFLLDRALREAVTAHLGRPLHGPEDEALRSGMQALLATTLKSFSAQREGRLRLEVTAMSHFLSSLAHDLRNEINGVMSSVELLGERGQDILQLINRAPVETTGTATQEVALLLHDVEACRNAMESTVAAMTRLLEAERLRNQVTLHRREVELFGLMNGVVRSATLADRGQRDDHSRAVERIKISCPTPLILWTDPDLLGTALVNLIGNAVKHAPEGEIHFKAGILPDGRCQISVRDHGPGIPAVRLGKIFEKFERGSRADSTGVGLGLFIVKRAADLLQGEVHVESESGRGSCFMLELPIRSAADK